METTHEDIHDQIKFANSIDLTKVEKPDRCHMRDIMLGIVQFNEIMPQLTISIMPTSDHYIVRILNWNQELDDQKWYDTFLNKESRKSCMDYVYKSSTVPVDDAGKAVKILRIRRISTNENTNPKKKK